MTICPVCGDNLVKKPIKKRMYQGMGRWKLKTIGYRYVCEYCVWKGNSGPGALLKTIILNAKEVSPDADI